MGIRRFFTDHPASVGETYGEHFLVAVKFSGELAKAAMACAMHAVVPAFCDHTASDKVRCLHDQMTSGARGAKLDIAAPATETAA